MPCGGASLTIASCKPVVWLRRWCLTFDLAAQVLFNFELGNQVYAKARVKPTTKANLWLGADVMLEYSLDEATQLLVNE